MGGQAAAFQKRGGGGGVAKPALQDLPGVHVGPACYRGPWALHSAHPGACPHTFPGSSSGKVQPAAPHTRPCLSSMRTTEEGAEVGEEAGCR